MSATSTATLAGKPRPASTAKAPTSVLKAYTAWLRRIARRTFGTAFKSAAMRGRYPKLRRRPTTSTGQSAARPAS